MADLQSLVVVVDKSRIQSTINALDRNGLLDRSRRTIFQQGSGLVPVAQEPLPNNKDLLALDELLTTETGSIAFACSRRDSRKRTVVSPHTKLLKNVRESFADINSDQLLKEVPKSWERVGDVLIFPREAFRSPCWSALGDELWRTVAATFSVSKLARGHQIEGDGFRTPKLELLLGNNGWTKHRENGIIYVLDVTRSMFASGNTAERVRVGQLSCEGETVVDMYAGIGYFTLPYILKANAEVVHACEWNPVAVEGLKCALEANRVGPGKCVIHFGDNSKVCPVGIADRVNLGLIPSSEEGWTTACRALRPDSGGSLHIHGCVNVKSGSCLGAGPNTGLEPRQLKKMEHYRAWSEEAKMRIKVLLTQQHKSDWTVSITNISHVKPYAPHIEHIVVDLICKPTSNIQC